LPDDKKLSTLRKAIAYLGQIVPKADHDMKQVQAAAHCLTQRPNIAARSSLLASVRLQAICRHQQRAFTPGRKDKHLPGPRQAEEGRMTSVWIYEKNDTLHFFDSELEAQAWLKQNDPQGVTTGHQPGELRPAGGADRYGVPRATERPHLRVVK
jgi:hypothetical protein